MAEWKLITPWGTLNCKKGRSYGEKIWSRPKTKSYGVNYFGPQGAPLKRDVFGKVGKDWIPSRGNAQFAPRMWHKDWKEQGSPKSIEGKKVGLVIQKLTVQGKASSGAQTLEWKAPTKKSIAGIEIKRFVSSDGKYIIPLGESQALYATVVQKLTSENSILITEPGQISSRSSVWYRYAIIPVGRYLVMAELLDESLMKPFPPDALIPSDTPEEIGALVEEDTSEVI